jgi:hypothetical protein
MLRVVHGALEESYLSAKLGGTHIRVGGQRAQQ